MSSTAKNIETRVSNNVEIRASEDTESRKIVGYAALFDSESENLGGFTEIIKRGAFSDALKNSDVRALFNHDANMVLARNISGTLQLIEDEKGLRYEFDAPNTSYGNDLLEMLRRGDVSQSSFGFSIAKDGAQIEERDGKPLLRTITKVSRLYDVSPVTYPAYANTTVAKRNIESYQNSQNEQVQPQDEYRSGLQLLNAWLMTYNYLAEDTE